ncbi:GFA family protein [Achromobacter sp. ACM04]|uniref:GFA family protein n=1 Tax=Achromobacter aegrifaciens TaxID=1287736 RepID=A0AAD2IWS4_ACHAE|nr:MULTISPECIES: GFA family protein [Achromobacter]MBD9384599.1 GFA family protein [Achromobacter sp. ACM02]MBD9419930.1 GFA family protein [Achromobacter sp. ACM04]MBD9431202.1 GFA family protein [Achromobacter sp. ACM03]MBD9472759.1 GFA family protein [Achromobacter sp. ACM01]MDQ1762316.1 GFA family protein [Achromobacter aegrifaciens]
MQDASLKRSAHADAQVHLTGGCQCGAVRYAITDEPIMAATCHCRDCQYSSGGAPAHALIFPTGSITLLRGSPKEHRYRGESGHTVMRSFCADCGTPLFGNSAGMGYDIVRAGSLDDPEAFRARATLWTESAPSWHHVDRTVPHFPRNSPAP